MVGTAKDFKWSVICSDKNTLIIRCDDLVVRNTKYVVLWVEGIDIHSLVTLITSIDNPDEIGLVGGTVCYLRKSNGKSFKLNRRTGVFALLHS